MKPCFDIDLSFPMETLSVECEFEPGYRGSREDPKEARGYYIERVYFRGVDITNALTGAEMDRLTEEVNESEAEFDEADDGR